MINSDGIQRIDNEFLVRNNLLKLLTQTSQYYGIEGLQNHQMVFIPNPSHNSLLEYRSNEKKGSMLSPIMPTSQPI